MCEGAGIKKVANTGKEKPAKILDSQHVVVYTAGKPHHNAWKRAFFQGLESLHHVKQCPPTPYLHSEPFLGSPRP
jgi:hypothetical protein